MATTSTEHGYTRITFPYEGSPGITVIGNAIGDEGGDDRIEIRTTDETGQVWRMWIERDATDGLLIATNIERMSGRQHD